MSFTLSATAWAIIGLTLIITELATSTFVVIFLGAAALLVALAKVIGLNSTPAELGLFAVASVSGIFFFRRKLLDTFTSAPAPARADEKRKITLSADLPANGLGTISYQGTNWSAHNISTTPLKVGDTAIIQRIEGTKLIVSDE